MPISVEFQKPIGNVLTTRQFEPGDEVRIAGKVTTDIGFWHSFQPVRFELVNKFPSYYLDSRTNFYGNYWFDIILPDVVTEAEVIITAQFYIDVVEQMVVPIGIGTAAAPAPLPAKTPFWENLPLLLVLSIGGLIVLRGMEFLPRPRRNPIRRRRRYLR